MAEVIVYYPERNGERDPAYIEGGIVGELVRCKYCWKREFDNCPFNEFSEFYKPDDDFFCADGERRGKNDG
jgi:hypothetical protein